MFLPSISVAFGLHGHLPKELAYLDHLQELDLSIMNYGLSGPIHSDILNMKSLNRLAIGETSLEVHIDCDKNPIEVITIGSCYNKGDDFDGTMTCHGGCCTDALTGMPCI